MRTLVEPPPSSRCDLCGGELRLKLIESANRTLDIESANHTLDLDNEILVCVKCGHEQSYTVSHNHTARHIPAPKAAYPTSMSSAPRPHRSAQPRGGERTRCNDGNHQSRRRCGRGGAMMM